MHTNLLAESLNVTHAFGSTDMCRCKPTEAHHRLARQLWYAHTLLKIKTFLQIYIVKTSLKKTNQSSRGLAIQKKKRGRCQKCPIYTTQGKNLDTMPKTTRLRKSAQGKRMTMFKSYSPLPALPPGCAGNEVEGGKKHTNRQTISGGGKESRSRAEA